MATLQVRDFPDELYQLLVSRAKAQNRSITQETIVLLKGVLSTSALGQSRLESVFQQIDAKRIKNSDTFPNPSDLIREDRER